MLPRYTKNSSYPFFPLTNIGLPPCCSAIAETTASPIPIPLMSFELSPLLKGTVSFKRLSAISLLP